MLDAEIEKQVALPSAPANTDRHSESRNDLHPGPHVDRHANTWTDDETLLD
jgi:hypothetical protein